MLHQIRKVAFLSVFLLASSSLFAESHDSIPLQEGFRRWYVGVHSGLAVGKGTFSSFGSDKFRPGWTLGIHGGYRLTRVWSLELTADWGRYTLTEPACCQEQGYFLGPDWHRYSPDLLTSDMQGWYYRDLKSRTFVQRYGLQVNLNVLGFFHRTQDSRWLLELSPVVYAVGTSSDILRKTADHPVREPVERWHLGYGGHVEVGYAIRDNLNIGIYGGFIELTGEPLDGLPKIHRPNFIIDAGLKFGFAFGKKKSAKRKLAPVTVSPVVVSTGHSEPSQPSSVVPIPEALKTEMTGVPTDTGIVAPMKTAVAVVESGRSVEQSKAGIPEAGREEEKMDEGVSAQKTVGTVVSDVSKETKEVASVSGQNAPDGVKVVIGTPNKEETGNEKVGIKAEQPKEKHVSPAPEVVASDFPVICFSFNGVWINPTEKIKVKAIAERMKNDASIRFRIIGWSDESGGEVIAKLVSLQRAEAVKAELVKHGISGNRIETVGVGIKRDVASAAEARIVTFVEIAK